MPDSMWTASAAFDEIASVSVEEEGGTFQDAVVLVRTLDGEAFRLCLPAQDARAEYFVTTLRMRRGQTPLRRRFPVR